MFDQMSMPVLFVVLIATLAIVSTGVFVGVRVLAVRSGKPAGRSRPAAAEEATLLKELD